MIVFLTLCYVAFLAILVKLGVVKLNLWWKLSPLVWGLLLLFVLFLPMQWGAPAGKLLVLNYVIEIIPNVSGQVTEVPVQPLTPVKKGATLFQIDRRQYQAEVDRLNAALSAAEQYVPQLEAAYSAASASLDESIAQRELAKLNFDRAESIWKNNPAAVSELQVDQSRQTLVAAEASVKALEARKESARLAWQSEIGGENTSVAELKAQLTVARLNLEWTTVVAPSDGQVVNIFLRPGQRVASFPVRSWMAFNVAAGNRMAVSVPQYVLRHVEPGQPAEVVLKVFPGKTFAASVDAIAPVNAEGQIQASGLVPNFDEHSTNSTNYAVVLKLDDERLDANTLPGGAMGTATIYTDSVSVTHVIRRVMMRMQTWMNYILP